MIAHYVASFLLASSLDAFAQDGQGQWLTFGQDARAIHVPIGLKKVLVEPAFEDYTYMVFDVCDAMTLNTAECTIYPMNGTVGGALAAIADGNAVIVYDRSFHATTSFDPTLVMAHEVGHHFCGHLFEEPSPSQELEADRFAAAALRKMGGSTRENLIESVSSLAERASTSHPSKADRIRALMEGWDEPEAAKNCHGN